MITVKVIDEANKEDVRLRNEPFRLFGRMIPAFDGARWSYTERLYAPEEVSELRFPDEPYELGEENTVFLGAYEDGECVGLAVFRDDMFKYLYLDDLKVNAACRGKGVGGALIEAAKGVALSRGYRGIYTIGQDDNLAACRFYLKQGFEIGGFDNRVYRGTVQEDKANILFYLDC